MLLATVNFQLEFVASRRRRLSGNASSVLDSSRVRAAILAAIPGLPSADLSLNWLDARVVLATIVVADPTSLSEVAILATLSNSETFAEALSQALCTVTLLSAVATSTVVVLTPASPPPGIGDASLQLASSGSGLAGAVVAIIGLVIVAAVAIGSRWGWRCCKARQRSRSSTTKAPTRRCPSSPPPPRVAPDSSRRAGLDNPVAMEGKRAPDVWPELVGTGDSKRAPGAFPASSFPLIAPPHDPVLLRAECARMAIRLVRPAPS